MPNVLKNSISDELSFVGFMPEDFPFEVDEGTEKKNETSEYNNCKFWERNFPNAVIRGEWPNEDDKKQRSVMNNKKSSKFFRWFILKHSTLRRVVYRLFQSPCSVA